MNDPTGPARERRMIDDIDASVLDTEELGVADLFADAATTTPPAGTVLGLFCQQAAALATLTQTEFAALDVDVAEQAVALALIDGAGALRCLADTATPHDGAIARLADALEQQAGALLYARSIRPGGASDRRRRPGRLTPSDNPHEEPSDHESQP
jgi:hypothetical protein